MKTMRRFVYSFLIVLAVLFPVSNNTAFAQSIIRDAETEWFLRKISNPFFEAAGLSPSAVHIYIIYDDSINAFATRGQIMGIHTGMIQAVDNLNELQGVIAHETGHIAGGHIVRIGEGSAPAIGIMIASLLIGIGAAAAGSSDGAIGAILGGQSMAQRSFLKYSRVQESRADQAAITYLNATQTSGEGLITFFQKLRSTIFVKYGNLNPYNQTHPLGTERVLNIQERIQESPYYGKPNSDEDVYWFRRIQAKLDGYLNDPRVTFAKYPLSDTSLFARYARVYAYQKALEFDKSVAEAQSLIDDYPQDPFFYEIAGQVLLETDRVEESLPYLRKAAELHPRESLILTMLGHALVALERPETDQEAIEILQRSVFFDPNNDMAWRQLSVVYARTGQDNLANLATAEMFALHARYPAAIQRATMAIRTFPEGSREWLQANDVILTAQAMMDRDPRFKNGKRR